jgi:general secretion pathway protein K
MNRPPPHCRQRGVAVITALLLTTLAVTIVASLFWQQQVQVRSIENQRLHLQTKWILRGALDWARLILREDAKFSTVDHLGEPWAVTLADTRLDQYVENARADSDQSDATLSGHVVDAQSRFNLSNLSANGTINKSEVLVFERLLSNLHLNPALAQATANLLASTQKTSAVRTAGVPADNAASSAAQPLTLLQLDDVLAVPGFTGTVLAALRDFVVVLPRATAVNVNTAPAEVLAARINSLSLSDATALVGARDRAYLRDIGDLKLRLPGKTLNESEKEIAVTTNFFMVYGTVRLNRASLEMQALIERSNNSTKVIWVRDN